MHRRKHARLRGLDYSNGWYLVTVCTRGRRCTLGYVSGDDVIPSPLGRIVHDQVAALPMRLAGTCVDAFVVMPNHVHVVLGLERRARQASPLRLGVVVGAFKSGSSREAGRALWQRGYHDHAIRDQQDLARVREYVAVNPIRWALDPENPALEPNGETRPSPLSLP